MECKHRRAIIRGCFQIASAADHDERPGASIKQHEKRALSRPSPYTRHTTRGVSIRNGFQSRNRLMLRRNQSIQKELVLNKLVIFFIQSPALSPRTIPQLDTAARSFYSLPFDSRIGSHSQYGSFNASAINESCKGESCRMTRVQAAIKRRA